MARRPSLALRLAAALLVPAAVLAAGQQQPQQTPPPAAPQLPRPTYTTEVSLVTADVTVVDKDGRPVTGLTAADFSVKVDGAPRPIVTAQFVNLQPGEQPAAAREEAPLVASNESVGTGRMIAFVIDQANIRLGGGKAVLRAAERLLSQLTPADRVAVFAVPGPGIRVSFTNDFALVREGLNHISGAGGRIEGTRFNIGLGEAFEIDRGNRDTLQEVAARECGTGPTCPDEVESDARTMVIEARNRASLSIAGIQAALSELVPIPGPKTVLLVSEGLPTDRSMDDLFNVGGLAARARASIYVLRLSGAAFEASEARINYSRIADAQIQSEGLETLAGLARGTVFNVSGSGSGIFERVSREISGYYLISFEPTGTDRDGKAHEIKIEVKRSGVAVRSRREFTVRTAAARGTNASDQELLGGALGSPVVLTDVPLRLTTYNLGDLASDKVRLFISAEIGGPQTAAAERGLAFALFDLRGRAVDSGLVRTTLLPRDPGTPSPLVYRGSLAVEPGDYVLKFAAVDDEGRVGTVERRVHARLVEAGGLHLSDIIVGPRRTSRSVSPPTEARVSRAAFSFVELYADRDEQLDAARVTLEVAETAGGPALVSAPALLAPMSTPRQRQALATLDVSVLPPGRYVVRARVDVDGKTVATETRPLAIEAAPAPPPGAAGAPPEGAPGPRLEPGSLVETFSRDPLFDPAVVGEFLDEVTFAAASDLPPAIVEAVKDAREGRLADAAEKAKSDRLHPLATFIRGLAALQQGQLDAAAGFFRATLHTAPGAYAPMAYLAACYAAGGRDDEAAGAFQTSLLGLDDSPVVYQMLADSAMRSGDAQAAMSALQEALGKWPDDARFTQRLGIALLLFGRPKDGLVALDRHLAAHPDDQRALFVAVQAVYGVNAAGQSVESPQQDLARAKAYAEAYARLGGTEQPLVKRWLDYLEKRAGESR